MGDKTLAEKDALRELAYAMVDEVAAALPSKEVVIRFRRRHAGFLRAYVVSDNFELGLLYARRVAEEGGNETIIGPVMEQVLLRHQKG